MHASSERARYVAAATCLQASVRSVADCALYLGQMGTPHVPASLRPTPRGRTLAVSAGRAGQLSEGAFFNRVAELDSLAKRLKGIPSTVIVVTGPPSSGKSGARATSVSYSFALPS